MAVSAAFRDYTTDLFAPFGEVKIRAMFGGAGIYHKDQIFGLIIAERIYLKTDEVTRPAFQREGSKPFIFKTKDGEIVAMNYLELPSRLLDDADELKSWAQAAYEAAIRSRGKKRAGTAKKTKGRSLDPRDLPLVSPRKKR
jgi:DNA transformation protein